MIYGCAQIRRGRVEAGEISSIDASAESKAAKPEDQG